LATPAYYGNQFWRSKKAGTIEYNTFHTGKEKAPANAKLDFEFGVPKNMKGMKSSGDEMTLIYKENHGNEWSKRRDMKYNIKCKVFYKNGGDYPGKVELGVEDDHDKNNGNPYALKGVKYTNNNVIKKYKAGDLIKARGSYQDTDVGGKGVRYKLEVQDPGDKKWKKIFDHIDYGDENHDIKNYRGSSAVGSAIRIDGAVPKFSCSDGKKLSEEFAGQKITKKKNSEQKKLFAKLGKGNISFKKISKDDGKEKPLSTGKER
jgi:hypothetical protein